MGLEHLGVVVGEGVDDFSRVHRAALTGQQFQSPAAPVLGYALRRRPTVGAERPGERGPAGGDR
jgi:hypothetical protein